MDSTLGRERSESRRGLLDKGSEGINGLKSSMRSKSHCKSTWAREQKDLEVIDGWIAESKELFFFFFSELHLQYMEVPWLGVKLELQLSA